MNDKIKSINISILAILILLLSSGLAAADKQGQDASVRPQVLTSLEQRMQKKISVSFRNTPIEDVLQAMADQAGVDIIKSPSVTGEVTATLKDVPLDEALNNLLAAHGYGYVTDKNMIRVASIEEISNGAEKLVSKIYRITYADVAEVEKSLQKFVSTRGSISSNPGTSNVIVTDSESKIKAIDTFVTEIDRITPEILVEARIYDITSKDNLDLGIQWQAGRNTIYTGPDGKPLSGLAGIQSLGNNPQGKNQPFDTAAFSGATSNTGNTSGLLRIGFLNSAIDIDALISAQKQNIDAKLLANPRVLVLDNKKAIIKIISEIPYQELSQTSGGGNIGSTNFRDVGVELEVIPHLTRDNMVRLQLKPKFSVKTGDVAVAPPGTSVALLQPIVDRREADTTLLIQSGQTVVLGGLRKKEVSKQINKIPFLGDMPCAGILFRFQGESTVTSEMVVFVTPWIMEHPVMSETEKKQFDVTEFNGPAVVNTDAEKEISKNETKTSQ